ncbi:MAG: hypothetical protein KJ606_04610 [Chloroflexi bacterium]|nr:hypothetical protein [Chloroflexota bacterium]
MICERWQAKPSCQAPVKKMAWDAEKGRSVLQTSDPDGNPLTCSAPLFEYSGLRREAAAMYVKKKARFFGSLGFSVIRTE